MGRAVKMRRKIRTNFDELAVEFQRKKFRVQDRGRDGEGSRKLQSRLRSYFTRLSRRAPAL